MKQFINTFSIEFPLLCGIMTQWPSKILVSLIPKLHILPNTGLMKRVCQLSSLINSNNNQVLKPPTRTKRLGIEVNELNLVMTRLGLHCEGEGPLDDDHGDLYNSYSPNRMVRMDEFEGLFGEEEPSFGEIKQAFDVFDRNGDGFIDALELNQVLSSLGLLKGGLDSHNVEVCKRILGGFDKKGVGLVDIHCFVRLMEKSL